MSSQVILALLATHFVADFLLQTDSMALNKSKSNKWLGLHVLVYTLCFAWAGLWFMLITAMLHFVVDYCTSRMTSVLWAHNERHWFFVTIGFDQLLHYVCLIYTYDQLAYIWWSLG